MPFDLNAAHQALGLDIPPATPQRPAVPWRSPGGPVLTHDAIARRVAELDRIANLDQMPTGKRALEFLKGLNPLAGFDFNAPAPAMPAGFRSQPAAPTQEQQADPLAQYRQLAGMIPAIAQAAPEVLENFTLALANRDPHAVGLLAQTVGTLPFGMTEMGPKVEQAGTALARVAETAPAAAFVNEAHAALGLEPLQLAPPVERKLLTAGRIEPSPGALANKDTQPFETLQLKKPLGEHTAEELDALQSKVQSAHARAQKAIESGAIGTTKPAEYDLQVLADERARRGPTARPAEAHAPLWDLGEQTRARVGLSQPRLAPAEAVDPAVGRHMAQTYDRLVSAPQDPAVQRAYRTFVDETQAQFDELQQAGYTFDFVEHDPYKNSAAMLKDLRENKHLSVYKTKPGEGHPLMTDVENDVFRAVHDARGHGPRGYQFGPKGEENAYREHAALYSPEAQRVLATETRGQNSWVNFGPESNRPQGQRPFATQKAALWPEELLGGYEQITPKAHAAGLRAHADGVTLDPRTAQPTAATGFAVADPAFTLLVKPGDDAKMAAWLESLAVKQRLQQPGAHLGAWRDPSNGQLEVNISDVIPDRQMALSMGALRNQKSVGSLVKGAYAGDVEVLPKFRPKPSEIEAYTPPARKVYHGTSSDVNFGIPTKSTDIGAHVGTPGQAESILVGSDLGPLNDIYQLPEGSRILPLELRGDAKLAKITRDLGDWHPHEMAAQLLKDNIITKDEAKGLLAQFQPAGKYVYADREIRAANAEIVKDLLEKKGYAGIEYPNKYEASGWDETSHREHARMLKAPSQVIFRPLKDLRNPLLSEKAFEGEKKAEMTRRGIPSVIAGEPTPKKLLAENLKRYPRGEPSPWIGGAPPAGPPKLGLPDEHMRGLAMNVAADKQYINESATSIIKRRYPHYAPYLDAKSTAKIEQLAKKFHAITTRFTPFDDTRAVKGVTRLSIARLAGSDEGQAIRKWYEGWKGAVGDALPPDAAEMLTRFSSILSAQKSPKDEVGMALAALDRWAHGEPVVTNEYMATTPERMKQLALAAKDQRWGKKALKTSGYYLARKGFKQTGALDRHVIRAYTGSDRVTPAQYEALWHRVNADADRMGLPFDEMQAAIWGGQTKYKAGAGEAGAAPEDWLAYHLASGNFDRLIKKYPGLEKLRAQGEQQIERRGLLDVPSTDWRAGHSPEDDPFFSP